MKLTACTLALASLLTFTAASRATADDWPQFRGPTGQGHSDAEGLPISWGRQRNVAWATEIPGKGWSSPIVVGQKVFLTTAVSERGGDAGPQSLRALRLDAVTGSIIWDREVFEQPPSRIHPKNSHASPTPISDGEHVFVHFGTHGTACLDFDGEVVWKTTRINYSPVHGSGGSPILVDDKLIVACDGRSDPFVVALDRRTGETMWRKPRPETSGKLFSFCTGLAIEVEGKTQVVLPASNLVIAYEPADGSEIWRVRYPHVGYSVVPRPVFAHGLVFISTGYDRASLLAIRPDGAGDVTDTHIAWSSRANIPKNPGFLVVGSELYYVSDNGIAACVDARTGKPHWRERLGGNFSASPLYGDGHIYFHNEDGRTYVLRPGKRYRPETRNDLDERSLASFAVVDSDLLIRTAKALWRIRGK